MSWVPILVLWVFVFRVLIFGVFVFRMFVFWVIHTSGNFWYYLVWVCNSAVTGIILVTVAFCIPTTLVRSLACRTLLSCGKLSTDVFCTCWNTVVTLSVTCVPHAHPRAAHKVSVAILLSQHFTLSTKWLSRRTR